MNGSESFNALGLKRSGKRLKRPIHFLIQGFASFGFNAFSLIPPIFHAYFEKHVCGFAIGGAIGCNACSSYNFALPTNAIWFYLSSKSSLSCMMYLEVVPRDSWSASKRFFLSCANFQKPSFVFPYIPSTPFCYSINGKSPKK